jgi:transposase
MRFGLTKKNISSAMGICERTVCRWLSDKQMLRQRKVGRPKKITDDSAALILSSLCRNPFQTQQQVVDGLAPTVKIHQSTLCRFLQWCHWTRKKVTRGPSRIDEERAGEWLTSVAGQCLSDFLALDETSFITTATGATHGYSPKGVPCHFQRTQRLQRERLTLLICIQPAEGRVVHHMIVKGPMNAVLFQKFIETLPAQHHHKKLILDNARIHHATKACQRQGLPTIRETAATKGIDLQYIPPYSPQLNPTEICFAGLKRKVRHLPWEAVSPVLLTARLKTELQNVGDTQSMFRKCLPTLR